MSGQTEFAVFPSGVAPAVGAHARHGVAGLAVAAAGAGLAGPGRAGAPGRVPAPPGRAPLAPRPGPASRAVGTARLPRLVQVAAGRPAGQGGAGARPAVLGGPAPCVAVETLTVMLIKVIWNHDPVQKRTWTRSLQTRYHLHADITGGPGRVVQTGALPRVGVAGLAVAVATARHTPPV